MKFNGCNMGYDPPLYFNRVVFDELVEMHRALIEQLFPVDGDAETSPPRPSREKQAKKGSKGNWNWNCLSTVSRLHFGKLLLGTAVQPHLRFVWLHLRHERSA